MNTALMAAIDVLIGAFLLKGGEWSLEQIRVRLPARKLWALSPSRATHIVTAQDEKDFQDEFTVKVYPAEYLAAVNVRSFLTRALRVPKIDLWTSIEFPMARNLTANIVSIGGPIHNGVTRLFLERIELPVGFEVFTAVSSVTGNRYDTELDSETGRISRDIGIAVLARNPFEPDCLVALLMGSRTFGCAGAALFLTSGNLRRRAKAMGAGEVRWALLDVDVIDDFVQRITVLESATGIGG